MQISDAEVPVRRVVAGEITARPETLLATKFETRLKGVARVRIVAMHGGAPIDEKYRQSSHALCFAVRSRVAEEARVRLEGQAPAPALLGRAFGNDDGSAATFANRQDDDSLLGNPHPIDKRALDTLRLSVFAEFLGRRFRKENGLGQRRLSSVVAPRNARFDLFNVRI